jgi:hypothetical protein
MFSGRFCGPEPGAIIFPVVLLKMPRMQQILSKTHSNGNIALN